MWHQSILVSLETPHLMELIIHPSFTQHIFTHYLNSHNKNPNIFLMNFQQID